MRRFILGALWRLITLVFAAGLLALGAGIIAWKLGHLPPGIPAWIAGVEPMLVASVALGAGVLMLPLVITREQAASGWHRLTLDPRTSVALSDRSLCAVIAYESQSIPGIRVESSRLRLTRKGWRIRCRVNVDATERYGEVIQGTLSDRIRAAMEAITGVPVDELSLSLRFTLPRAVGRVR
jgi:hypothetical protein